MEMPVSIFNDVLGPVMRGPSSSHTAAAVRIGRLARSLSGGVIKRVLVEFATGDSLETTYSGHGSDIGLATGFLGQEMQFTGITDSLRMAKEKGMEIRFEIRDIEHAHPNTYRLTLESMDGRVLCMTALSTGGGMIRVISIDDFPVEIQGGSFELLLYVSGNIKDWEECLCREFPTVGIEEVVYSGKGEKGLLNLKFSRAVDSKTMDALLHFTGASACRYADPVLPVLSGADCQVPFSTAAELLELLPDEATGLWEMAVKYEARRGNITEAEVWVLATGIYRAMREAVKEGLAGSDYRNRILGKQSHLIERAASRHQLFPAPLINRITRYVMAVMESKSSFGLIVAAPTAGSCGVVPGALLGCVDEYGFTEDDGIRGLLAVGIIGVFIATASTFSAEIGGCQAECGSASGMAAAGLVQLMGGDARTALHAASFALQNVMGLVCDPVGNRVEVPCLGKNIMAAVNGLTAANIALAGVDTVIPLDEVIAAMDSVGRSLPAALRCTGCGGLSMTPTARKIEDALKRGDYESKKTD